MDRYSYYPRNNKPPAGRGFFSYFVTGVAGAVVGAMLTLAFAPAVLFSRIVSQDNSQQNAMPQKNGKQNTAQVSTEQQVVIPQETEISLVTVIAKQLIPAVVGIKTTNYRSSMFFGNQKVEGVGSGVIVDKKGYIVTNNHVASKEDSEIEVSLSDGRVTTGIVVWTDEGLDLSVVKIEEDDLVAAELGSSDTLQVGEMAVAIGNPLGLRFERSVTSGIISALNRSIPVENEKIMEDLIQTDASINEGNSGGPLINSQGKVIGINTIKVTSAEGMGFAIPINIVVPVIKSLIEIGKFNTPYIGVSGLDKEIAAAYDYTLDKGIYVASIDPYGPAYEAGIREGDIILEINGNTINTLTALKQAIFNAGAGNEIQINYQDSQGNKQTVSATLAEINEE